MSRTAPNSIAGHITPADVARFNERVIRLPDGCWLWTGTVDERLGYGRFRMGNKRRVSAHRFSWVAEQGRDPGPGLELDHLCGNRRCVRPDHLEEVTYKVNVLRSGNPAAVNARKTHCPQGHAYDSENTYWRPDGRGRNCRACQAQRYATAKAQRNAS